MNERIHAILSSRWRPALAGLLAFAAASAPSPAGATRPPASCAALDPNAACLMERIPGFGERGRHGIGRGSMALAGVRGRSRPSPSGSRPARRGRPSREKLS